MNPSEIFEGENSSLRKTFDQVGEEELSDELAQAFQDFYFSKGALISRETWEETLFMMRQYEKRHAQHLQEKIEAIDFYGWNTSTQRMIKDKIIKSL